MLTAYDIGDEVLIKATVESITVTPKNEIVYTLSMSTAEEDPEDDIELFEFQIAAPAGELEEKKTAKRLSVKDDYIRRLAACKEIGRFSGYLDADMIYRLQTAISRLPTENVRHAVLGEQTGTVEL